MKTCPTCRRTYADDDLNFCLDDGSVLQHLTAAGTPETFLLNQTRTSDISRPPDTVVQQGVPQTQQQFTMKPKKSSRGGLWAIVILGLLVVACGGGLAVVGVFIASVPENGTVNNDNSSADNSRLPITHEQEIDLSGWTVDDGDGLMKVINGENVLQTRKAGYYYVLLARNNVLTEDAVTKLTVRNVDNKSTKIGYGLVFHSDTTALVNDHAFLIDTKQTRYRVVKHTPGKETDIVKWTRSSSIKGGTEKNVLEVRDKAGQIDFYVNGTKLTSIRNSNGTASGVAGIYASDALPVAFSEFVIAK